MRSEESGPLISVILPTYDRAHVLWRAIQSVLDQTETRWELIVVDDGSTDGTSRLLEEFRDDRIHTFRTPNRGPATARNHGLAHARGDFIAYLDSDNTWRDQFLEVMLAAADASTDDVLWYCGARETFWERTDDGEWHLIERRDNPRRAYTLNDVWQLKSPDTNCIFHRREIAETVGGWDEECRWLEDWDVFLRICLAYPDQTRWVPDILVDYRQVHGTGADGICAEAREDRHAEIAGRRYLVDKWGDRPEFAARDKLAIDADNLDLLRADST